jgi:hypothetical protein
MRLLQWAALRRDREQQLLNFVTIRGPLSIYATSINAYRSPSQSRATVPLKADK